ncbi:hypothetical protein [Niallia taxi]|uniref:hypothetical protein n=1 Tax=Niallia taxi TaxID=2499688 RepID=UPI0015F4F503|nr:hypothetical protein [Niallia taxi]
MHSRTRDLERKLVFGIVILVAALAIYYMVGAVNNIKSHVEESLNGSVYNTSQIDELLYSESNGQ